MILREARRLLEEIRVGRRICLASGHFEFEATEEGFSIDDVRSVLSQYSVVGRLEHQDEGVWRIRIDGMSADRRPTRLVIDLDPEQISVFVTIHSR